MLSFLYNLSTVPRSGQAAHVAVAPRTVAPCQAAPHGKVGAGFSQPPLPVRSRRPEPPLADRSPRAKRHPTVRSALALASRRLPYGRSVSSRRSPTGRPMPIGTPLYGRRWPWPAAARRRVAASRAAARRPAASRRPLLPTLEAKRLPETRPEASNPSKRPGDLAGRRVGGGKTRAPSLQRGPRAFPPPRTRPARPPETGRRVRSPGRRLGPSRAGLVERGILCYHA